jgi:hypothetical protein
MLLANFKGLQLLWHLEKGRKGERIKLQHLNWNTYGFTHLSATFQVLDIGFSIFHPSAGFRDLQFFTHIETTLGAQKHSSL